MIGIISGVGPKDPYRNLFKKCDILQLPCGYIPSMMQFVIDNQNIFFSGLEIHGLNTRSRNQLYLPATNLLFRRRAPCLLVLDYLMDCL
jgi:hypothetical protein